MRSFGANGFAIRCAMEEGSRIGRIALDFDGQTLGDFDQACVLARVADDLDQPLRHDEARRDLLISSLAPEQALDQVRAAIWHDDAPEDGWFWHHRLVWFDGSEPFDPWDSLLLSVPGGFRVHWRRHDERDRPAHSTFVPREVYRSTVYDFLAWLEATGAGAFAKSAREANPHGPHADDKTAYDKALHGVTATRNRELKLAKKNAQRGAAPSSRPAAIKPERVG